MSIPPLTVNPSVSSLSARLERRAHAARFGAEETPSADPATNADRADFSEAPQAASETPEAPTSEPASAPKSTFGALKTLAYSALGIALLIAPQRLGMRAGGMLALPATILVSIPFIIAKDMISTHAAKQGVRDYSDLRVLRQILDRNMREKSEALLGYIPFLKDETRQKLLQNWMEIYNTRVRSALNWVGLSFGMGDSARIPELEALPEKLKDTKTRREKVEIILVTLMVACRRAALVSGRRWLSGKAMGAGALALVLFKPLHAMFEKLLGADAQQAESELNQFEAARAARAKADAAAPAFA